MLESASIAIDEKGICVSYSPIGSCCQLRKFVLLRGNMLLMARGCRGGEVERWEGE